MYTETHRFYRYQHQALKGWESFQVKYRETDLWIRARRNLEREAAQAVLTCRLQLEEYIAAHEDFLRSLEPLPDDPMAPPLVRRMLRAANAAGVGPMASVAGAIAQAVGVALKPFSDSVIVENGGDCYLDLREQTTIGIFAGPRLAVYRQNSHKARPRTLPDRHLYFIGNCRPLFELRQDRRDHHHFSGRSPGGRGRNPAGQHGEKPGRY